jgi:tRNA(Leu) C34 or U34 (ribose-2'-O)-methylase TrmL
VWFSREGVRTGPPDEAPVAGSTPCCTSRSSSPASRATRATRSGRPDDVLLFGPEPSGLPDDVLAGPRITDRLRIPMLAGRRSMNLANAAAVAMYEAWRQVDFTGGT